ncbi:Stress responsive alpha-beta barrel domain protein [Prunus dulcis]|uniref:Stress responsive alpha-beta barrel domain protein n=1 Tax=Prunus dulcis TaxID=3755 RepID=A0A5H2XQ41_PRUDU|nr:Stress responsive alpha-beta barrel domain protein [Prunus dulcis]
MLDFLYTTQYQMRGILAVSLGRICNENIDKYTHAVYMRFQEKRRHWESAVRLCSETSLRSLQKALRV